MARFELPDGLRHNISSLYADGAAWLDSLDDCVAEFEQRWNMRCDTVFRASMSFVVRASNDSGPFAVLKLMPPESEFFTKELAAHAAFKGSIAALLQSDVARGAMLIELVQPGDTLRADTLANDDYGTDVIAACLQQLWRPAPAFQFPTVAELADGFAAYDALHESERRLDGDLVRHARRTFDDLIATQGEQVLLHGDLHHANVLRSSDEWCVIDPQGLVGEREYDLTAAMRNPFEPMTNVDDLVAFSRHRAARYGAALDLDENRILQWAFTQTALSLCWMIADKRPLLDGWLRLANALAPHV
jgi:streptomycin 6-kinase